jgi:preprotein translocase subunit YajC
VASLILIAAMFALLWLLLIRPQRQRQVQQQRLIADIEPGDEVLTVGGLYGIVQEIDEEDDLVVEIADGVHVRIARRAVGGVVKPDDEEDDELDEGDGEEGVNDSEEIVSAEDAEGTAALDRR